MAKRFFLVCLGVLCLAIAYHVGAERAIAQAAASSTTGKIKLIAASGETAWVVTDNDDIIMVDGKTAPSVSHGDCWAKFRAGMLH